MEINKKRHGLVNPKSSKLYAYHKHPRNTARVEKLTKRMKALAKSTVSK